MAFALIAYIRAGNGSAEKADDAYFSGQRWHRIYKKWRELRCCNNAIGATDEETETFYVRFCTRFNINEHVKMCDWKPILEVIASRLEFYAANNLSMPEQAVKAVSRLVRIARALKYGV
jgi:hypothetical protein